jgi:hypothetical protein
MVQRGIGYAFAGTPAFQKFVGSRHSIRVNVERPRRISDIWKAQHSVVKHPLVKQFPPDNHSQTSSQPKLERTSENEAPAIKPAAAVLPGEGRKNTVRVCEAIQGVFHEAGPNVCGYSVRKESRKEQPQQRKAAMAS